MKSPVKLSPSDLTFLWDECRRCFYLKYVHGITRPLAPFPAIFGTIDRLMKEYYQGRPVVDLDPSLPSGSVQFADKWVESLPISIPGHEHQCYIKGKFDSAIAFEDGSFGVIDFKTSEPKPSHIPFYSRQLHAYSYALEHPAGGTFSLFPISRLGLLVITPTSMEKTTSGQIAFIGTVTWMEIQRNDAAFLQFLGEVMSVLEQPDPPPAGEKCGYCKYREQSRGHAL
jgi:hypothetical protein